MVKLYRTLQALTGRDTGSYEPVAGDGGPPPGFAVQLAAEVAKSRPDAVSGEALGPHSLCRSISSRSLPSCRQGSAPS